MNLPIIVAEINTFEFGGFTAEQTILLSFTECSVKKEDKKLNDT